MDVVIEVVLKTVMEEGSGKMDVMNGCRGGGCDEDRDGGRP